VHSDSQVDWRQALNQSGFGLAIVLGEDRRLLDLNDAFAAMHGYEAAEMLGKSLDEFSAPSNWKPLGFTTRANAGPRQQLYQSIHIRRDGTTFACITDMTPHQDRESRLGEHDAAGARVAYFSDIIGLDQIESSVRDSEERFRSLAAALPQLIWSTSAEGALEYVNPLWRTYAGWTADQEPVSDPWSTLLHPEDQNSYMDRWKKVLKSGDIFEIQCRLKHMPDGLYRWFLCRAVPLRDSNGKIVRRKWAKSCSIVVIRSGKPSGGKRTRWSPFKCGLYPPCILPRFYLPAYWHVRSCCNTSSVCREQATGYFFL